MKIFEAYNNYIKTIEKGISADPKQFWSFINNIKGTSRMPGRMHFKNQIYYRSQNIINGFSHYFIILTLL